jgi:TolA-binding protein
LREGSVVVVGCALGSRKVRSGESLRTTCEGPHEAVAVAAAAKSAEASLSSSAPLATAAAAPSTPAVSLATPASVASAGGTPEPSWNDLAAQGRYSEALALVRGDFESRCASAPVGDLLLLADVARYAGDDGRAKAAWLALRARFPRDARSASAAFFLGRASFGLGEFSEAERWFVASLQDAPSGTFAREAAGRLIEACQRAGDEGEARKAAMAYLREYPTGPHAQLAQSVTGN